MSRVVAPHLADACMARVDALEEEIEAILSMEKEERALGEAERDVRRGENLVEHEAEIKARPKRTWFATEREKGMARERGRKELNGVGVGDGVGSGQQADIAVAVNGNGIGSARGSQSSHQSKKVKVKGKLSNNQKKALEAKKEIRDGRAWKKGKGMGDSRPVVGRTGGLGKGTGKGTGKTKTKMKGKIPGKPKSAPKQNPIANSRK